MSYSPSAASLTCANGKKIPWLGIVGNDHPISPELALALAGVVIQWSALEGAIRSDLSNLMRFKIVRDLTDQPPRSFKKLIELWKRAVHTLFPTVPCYLEAVDEISKQAKIVAHHRNRLIHGHWLPPPQGSDGGEYRVMLIEGLDRVTRLDHLAADVAYVTALRNDIKTLSDAVNGFLVNRTLHANWGLWRIVPPQEP